MTVIGAGPPADGMTAVDAAPTTRGPRRTGFAPDTALGGALKAALPRPIVAGWLATTNASPT